VAFTYLKVKSTNAFVYFRWSLSWSWSCYFGLVTLVLVLVLRIWSLHHWWNIISCDQTWNEMFEYVSQSY